MRKITDFIVNKRNIILVIFVILTGVCLYTSTKVIINSDIAKYLPATSETKIGKDIMDEEFGEIKSSTLNVMFKNLSEEEKQEKLKELQNIEGVSSVDYDNTKEYNNGDYTLYTINVDDYDHSKTAEHIYDTVDNMKPAAMSGSIYTEFKPVLQVWIIAVAIAMAMVILTILSESYIEPWLYLTSIGIAVFINKGTNIIFPSVSNITDSITAILQLALSMDYSIMLSNRYRQERSKEKDKVKAMKNALFDSFKAISSSSITTVVGLLALVFMSFTIGRDLGFVLAKGVLLSLVSIFFCLPGLLVMCDKLIMNSKKKTIDFNLTKIGKYIYKTRWGQLIFIIIAFVTAYILKGNIGILYTGSQQDEVGKHFPSTNQIAIVYKNEYEEIISKYCKSVEDDEKANQVLCYGNTINEKLAYDELNDKFKDLGQDTEIDDYLIKIIYYNYYNKNNNDSMTLNEFISFIKSDVYTNDKVSDSIDNNVKDNINLLENFATKDNVNKKRTVSDIANILGMNESDAKDLLILYNSKYSNTIMTIKEFVNFMIDEVSVDPVYGSSVDNNTLASLKQLKPFIDSNNINKKMTSSEIAATFGIDKNMVDQLFLFYRTTEDSTSIMTINEFATYALNLKSNPTFASMFNEDTTNKLTLLKTLSDVAYVNKQLSSSETAGILSKMGIDNLNADTVSVLYFYDYYLSNEPTNKLTINQFASLLGSLKSNSTYSSYVSSVDESTINTLKTFSNNALMNSPLDYEQMASSLSNYGFTKEIVKSLYIYNYLLNNNSTSTTMTLNEFATLALSLDDETLACGNSCTETRTSLTKLKSLSDSNITSTKLDADTMSASLGVDINTVNYVYGNASVTEMSISEFITACGGVNSQDNTVKQTAIIIANQSTKMDYNTISAYVGISADKTKILYLLNDATVNTISKTNKLSVNELISFILTRYNANDSKITNSFNADQIASLKQAAAIINLSANQYTYNEMATVLGAMNPSITSDSTKLLYGLYNYQAVQSTDTKSIKEIINFIVANQNDPMISSKLGDKKETLVLAYTLVNNTNTKYSYKEMAKLIGQPESTVKSIYGVIDYNKSTTSMTPYEFVSLILNNKDNELLKGKIDNNTINTLKLVKTVMDSTLNNTKYNAVSFAKLLGSDKDTISLVMSLYNSRYIKVNQTISLNDFTSFILSDVVTDEKYSSKIDNESKEKLKVVNGIIKNTNSGIKYNSLDLYNVLNKLSDELDYNLVDIVYIYHGSKNNYDNSWKLTVEQIINYLNDDLLKDEKYSNFIDKDMEKTIKDAKTTISDAKNLLVTNNYSRAIINSKYGFEDKDTFEFIQNALDTVGKNDGVYVIGDSPMALEMSQSFNGELNYITILTMIFIFVVVALTFKDLLVPFILVLIIQCAVFVTMAILTLTGTNVYFIALLIVQAILMGATIDYAIVYTTYYKESRQTMGVQDSMINAYNKSIHTILSSASILIIVTLVVASFSEAIPAMICKTVSEGTLCSVILIVFVLPGVIAAFDKFICRKNAYKEPKKIKKNAN